MLSRPSWLRDQLRFAPQVPEACAAEALPEIGRKSKADLDFDQNMSVILEDNGWGKSTLANFIKAMFYSLPVTKTKSLDSNPRKKFKPWDNSVFGGTLTFENDGKIYKIERSFGLAESEDTFYLFDAKTNKASN